MPADLTPSRASTIEADSTEPKRAAPSTRGGGARMLSNIMHATPRNYATASIVPLVFILSGPFPIQFDLPEVGAESPVWLPVRATLHSAAGCIVVQNSR